MLNNTIRDSNCNLSSQKEKKLKKEVKGEFEKWKLAEVETNFEIELDRLLKIDFDTFSPTQNKFLG